MKNNRGKLALKVKRFLLDFEDDEEQLRRGKQKTELALERLRKTSKKYNRN